MPSNYNFVCFECRVNVRRAKTSPEPPCCPHCGKACCSLGYKIPVPQKDDSRAWQALQHRYVEDARARLLASRERAVGEVHALERQLADLERRPANRGRNDTIRELKRQLESARRRG